MTALIFGCFSFSTANWSLIWPVNVNIRKLYLCVHNNLCQRNYSTHNKRRHLIRVSSKNCSASVNMPLRLIKRAIISGRSKFGYRLLTVCKPQTGNQNWLIEVPIEGTSHHKWSRAVQSFPAVNPITICAVWSGDSVKLARSKKKKTDFVELVLRAAGI